MKFGVCIPHYGIPLDVDNLTDMAVKAEEMGFDSVWGDGPYHCSSRNPRPA